VVTTAEPISLVALGKATDSDLEPVTFLH